MEELAESVSEDEADDDDFAFDRVEEELSGRRRRRGRRGRRARNRVGEEGDGDSSTSAEREVGGEDDYQVISENTHSGRK